MSTGEKDTPYVICVGSTPEDVARLTRALNGAAVVVAASDAEVVGALLANAGSLSDGAGHLGADGTSTSAGGTATPDGGTSTSEGGTGASEAPSRYLRVGPLVMDRGLREVAVDGQTVDMSAREFDLLQLLAGDTGKVWTFADIAETVWKVEYLGDTDMLFSAVKRLRRRLAAVGGVVQVVSVRGVGFRLVAEAGDHPAVLKVVGASA
ncbi:MAG: winged helix-turn-helix domain-containing protein [Galactobacter sp.]